MKKKFNSLFIALVLLAGVRLSLGTVTNLAIAPAGDHAVLTWPAGATNYILQSATNLSAPNWVTVSNAAPGTNLPVAYASPARFFRLSQNVVAPAGMALIPAGSYTIGDSLNDGIASAPPTNVYVSAFFMDTNLIRYNDQWSPVFAYATSHGYGFDNPGSAKATNHPVGDIGMTL